MTTSRESPPEVDLTPFDAAAADELARGDMALASDAPNLEAVASGLVDIGKAYVALYARTQAGAPWTGYLARRPDGGDIIGTCGFKDKPRGGSCEIAYYTFPDFTGRGYARAMAARLVEIACREPEVRQVLAHTLPEPNTSGRILAATGFRLIGPVEDPEDGTVWQYALTP